MHDGDWDDDEHGRVLPGMKVHATNDMARLDPGEILGHGISCGTVYSRTSTVSNSIDPSIASRKN